jgi:pyruvate/2-oxoglutarate dehydrogenase complex dihydrolipoamide dehydrogenase (E3) component
MDFQFIAIGAGTAGKMAAKTAASHGVPTAIVEEDGFAGTCLGKG